MIVTNDLIKSFNPCQDGYEYWLSVALPDLVEFMRRAHSDGNSNWANWLFCRVAPRDVVVRYASNARSVLNIFESSSPSDGRPREVLDAIDRGEVTDEVLVASRATYAAANAAANAAYAATYSSRAEKWGEILEFGISILEKEEK